MGNLNKTDSKVLVYWIEGRTTKQFKNAWLNWQSLQNEVQDSNLDLCTALNKYTKKTCDNFDKEIKPC